ncbi:unnamed protein product [Soboliphyme baturini]|uniref:WD repeat-containing protein 44 n=1 Tax=Soboliphyme baturini TaxID=241478 RepID=A0A183IQV1_9BILA|nr:unnamed protein product [Soboliphyme baturini]
MLIYSHADLQCRAASFAASRDETKMEASLSEFDAFSAKGYTQSFLEQRNLIGLAEVQDTNVSRLLPVQSETSSGLFLSKPCFFASVSVSVANFQGAVWCVKFSLCGRLLATAGQDNVIRIWVLKDAYKYFDDMRRKGYNKGDELATVAGNDRESFFAEQDDVWAPFTSKPFCCYHGHTADVLDISWSKNYFILSSSMDRTVRLWHVSRMECLCCFQHIDFVTAIAFLPKDDRYFLSGSLDGKLRLWHIPEKKVALWNEVDGGRLITALTFARNGKFVVVGTYDGRCNFYSTDQLKYHTQIDINSNRMKTSRNRKITGLQSYQDKLLVTSNDSRIRVYDLRDLSLSCKYKGYTNHNSQIRASFSHSGRFIITGSEDKHIYLWKTHLNTDTLSLSVRKDRNRQWESIRAHNAVVTAAVFAPKPEIIFDYIERCRNRHSAADVASFILSRRSLYLSNTSVLVSADMLGTIYVFLNKSKVNTDNRTFIPSY